MNAASSLTRPTSQWQAFLTGCALAGLLVIVLHAVFAPPIGAPEGERVLAIGPIVITELTYETDGAGLHHWEHRTNYELFVPVILLAGWGATRLVRSQPSPPAVDRATASRTARWHRSARRRTSRAGRGTRTVH